MASTGWWVGWGRLTGVVVVGGLCCGYDLSCGVAGNVSMVLCRSKARRPAVSRSPGQTISRSHGRASRWGRRRAWRGARGRRGGDSRARVTAKWVRVERFVRPGRRRRVQTTAVVQIQAGGRRRKARQRGVVGTRGIVVIQWRRHLGRRLEEAELVKLQRSAQAVTKVRRR